MWDKMETPTIVYDLDTSGGLMEQIQSLLAPPKSEDGEKRSRKPEKEARRSGRATNHDTCDSCREGGDLLCCDHCPAAFHLQCCNPPLSEEMLPPGDWMCHRCSVRRKKREQRAEQMNGALERGGQVSKCSGSPSGEVELGAVRLDGVPGGAVRLDGVPGGVGLRMAVAQVRLLERRSSRPGTPTSSVSTDTATPSEANEDEDLLDEEDPPGSEAPGNPTQFQLPNELTCTTALPGSSKRKRREEMSGKNVKRPQHELDHNGLVPLPVKVCFTCTRSCRVAPLIPCDYCPLLFHMDCLDPPLTAMPTGKWMCPNHMEHVVLSQKNMTLSNRCQLFDHFQDRISQHAVKVDFLRRVHRQHPPNRRGVHSHRKRTLKVPEAIKAQYKCPPQMLATAGIRNGELICTGVPETPETHPTDTPHATSEAEQQEWLRDVITLQCSIMRHLSCRRDVASRWDSEPGEKADVKPCVAPPGESLSLCPADRTPAPASPVCSTVPDPSGAPAVCGTVIDPPGAPAVCITLPDPKGAPAVCSTLPDPKGAPAVSSTLPDPKGAPAVCSTLPDSQGAPGHRSGCGLCSGRLCQGCRTANGPVEDTARANGPLPCGPSAESCKQGVAQLRGPARPCSPTPPTTAPRPINHAAGAPIKSENICRVSSPPAGTRALTPPRAPPDAAVARLASPMPPPEGKGSARVVSPALAGLFSSMKGITDGDGELELSDLDERLIKLLAWQRIQQLLPPKALPAQTICVTPPQTTTTTTASPAPAPAPAPPLSEVQKSEVQARAVFYPLTGRGGAVNMCYRTLYIGTGADMDVCLTNYGHCNYVSGKHACIFYDENTKHYELLNYSEHGTTVDNVLYSCDFSEKSSPCPASSVLTKVHNVIRRCKRRKREEEGRARRRRRGRGCKASSSSLIGGSGAGWEGTALLHHGSYIKLGCLQFVFSLAEFSPARRQPRDEPAAVPPAGQEGPPEPEHKHTLKLYQVPVLRSNSVP
ncbi:hypothetical protein COCON_G00191190 [Conger conger]|uniref:PHD finger protein 12 n=1 Tax=Conger conger TaxID=82655 RepID=A0A9Q1HSB2_CONCO|nr:hypothetical protein COCON_G00191190 [Conger conger]